MTVDLSRIAPGDEVTLRMRVIAVGARVTARFIEGGAVDRVFIVSAHEIVTHTPKALSVGDRVRETTHAGLTATVLFADERDVVIRYDIEGGGIHSGRTDSWARTLERLP